MITKTNLKAYLKEKYKYSVERRHSLEAWLGRYLCALPSADIENYLKDISFHGCASGCVGELIYDSDIVTFYGKYESQIWELIYEFLEETGHTLGKFLDTYAQIHDEISLKIYLTWFAVETLAFKFLGLFNTAANSKSPNSAPPCGGGGAGYISCGGLNP